MKATLDHLEANLRLPSRAAMLLAIMLTTLCGLNSARAQLRVATYNYTADVGTDFHTFSSIAYTYGHGMTNLNYTNVTSGWIITPGIVGAYCTNGCGWDTNTDGLLTIRSREASNRLEDNSLTNQVSDTEQWSGEHPLTGATSYPAISMGYVTASVTFDYLTGGDPTNSLSRIYEISVFDTLENGSIPLDLSEAMVNGTNCDAEGKAYFTWTDCTTNTVSVTFPGTRTNVYYKVNVGMVRPHIFLVQASYAEYVDENTNYIYTAYTTNLVTDATNTVVVGGKITLFCKMAKDDGTVVSVPAITNWSWTIGGKTLSNYVANSTSGQDYESYPKNQESCVFYWKSGISAAEVKCNVTVNGAALLAVAYIDVYKPTNSFAVTVGSTASFDANHLGNFGTKSVHWGNGEAGVSVGFTYDYDRTSQTNWTVCQLITATRKVKDNGGIWRTRSGTSVLDELFPNNNTSDSPSRYVSGKAVSADDKFDVWLMYNPQTPGSIWVPVWRCSQFGWSGSAEDPNADGTWPATSATVSNDPGPFNVSLTDEFPKWTQNWLGINYVP